MEEEKLTGLPCSRKVREMIKVCQARNNYRSYDETLTNLVMLDPKVREIYDASVPKFVLKEVKDDDSSTA